MAIPASGITASVLSSFRSFPAPPHGSPIQNSNLPWHLPRVADRGHPIIRDGRRFYGTPRKGKARLPAQDQASRLTGTIRPILVVGRPIVLGYSRELPK